MHPNRPPVAPSIAACCVASMMYELEFDLSGRFFFWGFKKTNVVMCIESPSTPLTHCLSVSLLRRESQRVRKRSASSQHTLFLFLSFARVRVLIRMRSLCCVCQIF